MYRILIAIALGACSGKDVPGDTAAAPSTPAGTTSSTPTTAAVVPCPSGGAGPELETTTGCYRGRVEDGAEGFLGIGFAEPPVGPLRWARPVPIAPRPDPVDATALGSPCIQTWGTVDFELAPGEGDEDCLYLNVIRPEGTQPGDGLPIVFFVHGGSHTDGHGGSAAMIGNSFNHGPDDPPLVPGVPQIVTEQRAILVTTNYRLGQLGWLALPGLSAESADGASGNQGLWDVLTALRWVHDNAVQLGGDPGRILLDGESAGSVNACALLAAPQADGLYGAAMLQSGGCAHVIRPLTGSTGFVESGEDQGLRLAAALGCDGAGDDAAVLDCMRALPADQVMAVMQGGRGPLATEGESWGILVDGALLPDPPADRFEAGQLPQVRVALGVTADEGTLFTSLAPIGTAQNLDLTLSTLALLMGWNAAELQDLYDPATRYGGDVEAAWAAFYGDFSFVCPMRRLAGTLSPHVDVHTYWWTHTNPFTAFLGAHHGVEIAYAFGNGPDLGDDATMNDVAAAAWASVAAGAPAITGVGPWPTFGAVAPDGGTWVELSPTPAVLPAGPRKAECDWMDAQGWP